MRLVEVFSGTWVDAERVRSVRVVHEDGFMYQGKAHPSKDYVIVDGEKFTFSGGSLYDENNGAEFARQAAQNIVDRLQCTNAASLPPLS